MSEHDKMDVFEYSMRDGSPVRFGICICYESHIPEYSRVLAVNGAELIICPSLTLTDAGYNRIRYSCEARCIENQLLIVLSSTLRSKPIPSQGYR